MKRCKKMLAVAVLLAAGSIAGANVVIDDF